MQQPLPWTISPWPHNLSQQASGNPGAVQGNLNHDGKNFWSRYELNTDVMRHYSPESEATIVRVSRDRGQ